MVEFYTLPLYNLHKLQAIGRLFHPDSVHLSLSLHAEGACAGAAGHGDGLHDAEADHPSQEPAEAHRQDELEHRRRRRVREELAAPGRHLHPVGEVRHGRGPAEEVPQPQQGQRGGGGGEIDGSPRGGTVLLLAVEGRPLRQFEVFLLFSHSRAVKRTSIWATSWKKSRRSGTRRTITSWPGNTEIGTTQLLVRGI